MTFRSFSRFVRWYRWPLRWLVAWVVVLVFAAEKHHQAPVPSAWPLVPLLALLPGVVAVVVASDHLGPVWKRHRRIRGARIMLEKQRLRSQPLRGWTK